MATKNLIIYDADPDGFGCAYAAWKALPDGETDFMEILHGSDIPPGCSAYENVYILDLSFSRDEMESLASFSKVTVIDHHPSAKEDVEKLRLNPFPFNTEEAACVQSWDFFHPYEPRPKILQYVGDRDTWTFELPASEAINQYIYTVDQTFLEWSCANEVIETQWEYAMSVGNRLLKYRDRLVDEIVKEATTPNNWQGAYSIYGIPFVSAPVLHSEVGHRLLDEHPNAPFAVTFYDEKDKGTRKYSLRSEDHRVDVGKFASERGGGGHHNAAGFRRSLDDIWKEGHAAVRG